MTSLPKRLILRGLDRLGYVVVKSDSDARMRMGLFKRLMLGVIEGLGYRIFKRGDHMAIETKPLPAPSASAATLEPRVIPSRAIAEPEPDVANDSELQALLPRLGGNMPTSPIRAKALYAAARYIVASEVPGDVVDC